MPELSSGFPYFLQLSLNLAIRSSWSEPQSAPGLVFADFIELLYLQKYNQSDFGFDHLMMSMCRVFSCVVGRGCLLWPVCSLRKHTLPASFCIPRPYLPVTPGISWPPTFAFQSPIMKMTLFCGVSSRRLQAFIEPFYFSFLQHSWSGHRLGLLWYLMVFCFLFFFFWNEQR